VGAIPEIQINRIGIIPKKSSPGKWRLITDLLFPTENSVNDGINPETSYFRIDEVANQVAVYGKNTKLAKVDIEEAYRLVPIHADDKQLLEVQWEGMIYVDATLPFSLRSAPIIFTALADGLEWILHQRGIPYIAHYLDDFIILALGSDQCSAQINAPATYQSCLIHVRNCMGIPLASHKTAGPITCLTFLGIEIDSAALELRLPQEKLCKLKDMLIECVQCGQTRSILHRPTNIVAH
jgi:hypothetical protein